MKDKLNRIHQYFWYQKHYDDLEVTHYNRDDFWGLLVDQFKYESTGAGQNTILDWNQIEPNYHFFFDYEGCEPVITTLLQDSSLANYSKVLVDTSDPDIVLRTNAKYFINNWYEFVLINSDMGFAVLTEPYDLVMEFTHDGHLLYSNFKIK